MKILAGLVASLWLTTAPAFANDTTAQVAAGGLIYVQNENVSMADEKLYISMEKVTVDYIFHNNSDKDVESLIAFPFPDVTGSGDFMDGVPDTESDNFLDFQATQDGKPIVPDLQQRAFSLGLDVTDELVKAGVPLVLYWMMRSMTGPSSLGACSQPTRQPVMAQFFEKVLASRSRSSTSQTSRNEGARASFFAP